MLVVGENSSQICAGPTTTLLEVGGRIWQQVPGRRPLPPGVKVGLPGGAKMASPAAKVDRPLLITDVLCLVAYSGYDYHVARWGCALNRHVWTDSVLWRAIINVKFDSNHSLVPPHNRGLKTRLMIYISRRSLPRVELALSYGATVNCPIVAPSPTDVMGSRFLTSPIILAVECAAHDPALAMTLVKLLLDRGADASQAKLTRGFQYDVEGVTPLEIAAGLGNVDLMRLLVTGSKGGLHVPGSGVDADDFCRPLQLALELHHLDAALFLLDTCGVKINYSKVTEAEAGAAGVVHSYLGEILRPSRREFHAYHQSNQKKEQEERNAFARILLERGALPSYTLDGTHDDEIGTPLHLAMSTGNMAAFKMLLEEFNCDPNPNMLGGYRLSVLLEAAQSCKLDYATVLVDANANVNVSVHYGPNPWDLNEQWQNTQDWTALHFFSSGNCLAGMELVIEAGAEIDAQTFLGYSALLLCAKGHHRNYHEPPQTVLKAREAADVACCELLLVSGSNATQERDWGVEGFLDGDDEENEDRGELRYTASTYAVIRNAPALLSLLCLHGADIRQVPADGYTLLMRAVEKGNVECLAMLLEAGRLLPAAQRQLWLNLQFGAADDDDDDDEFDEEVHAKDGQTALTFCLFAKTATDVRFSNMFGMLLQAGASYTTIDGTGCGPQQLCVKWNCHQCLAQLLDHRYAQTNPVDASSRKEFTVLFKRSIVHCEMPLLKALLRSAIFAQNSRMLSGALLSCPYTVKIGGSINVPSSVKLTALQFAACTAMPAGGLLLDELCLHMPRDCINAPCSFEIPQSLRTPKRVEFDTLSLVTEKCPGKAPVVMQKGASLAPTPHSSLLLALRESVTNVRLLSTVSTWDQKLVMAVVQLCLTACEYEGLESVLSRVSYDRVPASFLLSAATQMYPYMVSYRELLHGVATLGHPFMCRLLLSDSSERGHRALDSLIGASDSILLAALRHGHSDAARELVAKASVAQLNLVLPIPPPAAIKTKRVANQRGFLVTVTYMEKIRVCLTLILPSGLHSGAPCHALPIVKFMGRTFNLSDADYRGYDRACWVLHVRDPVLCPLMYALTPKLVEVALSMISAGARLVELDPFEAFVCCTRLSPSPSVFDALLSAMLADQHVTTVKDPQWSRFNCVSCFQDQTVEEIVTN